MIFLLRHAERIDQSKDQKEKDKLANTNNILENIIENAPIIIFWKDRNGVYKGSNKLFLELMNLKDERKKRF